MQSKASGHLSSEERVLTTVAVCGQSRKHRCSNYGSQVTVDGRVGIKDKEVGVCLSPFLPFITSPVFLAFIESFLDSRG